jgi:hypothetical protein
MEGAGLKPGFPGRIGENPGGGKIGIVAVAICTSILLDPDAGEHKNRLNASEVVS